MAPFSSWLKPMDYVQRQVITRGVFGKQRVWLVVGGLVWGFKLLRRAADTKQLRAVLTDDLAPGESLVITHLPNRPQ